MKNTHRKNNVILVRWLTDEHSFFRNSLSVLLGIFLFAGSMLVAQENTSVTITNSNIGLVKEERRLDLKKGRQNILLEDIPAQINAASARVGPRSG